MSNQYNLLISDPDFLDSDPAPVYASPQINEVPEIIISEKKSEIVPNFTREDFIFRRIFDDVHLQGAIIDHLEPNLFSDKYKRICLGIQAFNNQFNRFPSAAELIIGFPENATERESLIELMKLPIDSIAMDVSGSLIKKYFREKISEIAIIDAIQCVRGKSVDNLPSVIENLEKGINFSLDIDVGLSARTHMKEILERLNQTFVAIPSALSEICEFTESDEGLKNGGWYLGLSLFLGMPNVGKTIMLCNEAAYAYRHGYNVLYVSLEMAEEFIHQRIISNVCQINSKKVKSYNSDELLKTFETNVFKQNGNLHVKRMPTSTTVNDIDALIRQIEKIYGYKIDFLVVDYIGIMKPIRRANTIQNMNMYSVGKEVAEQLRDLAYKYKIPVLTASQLNREGYSNLQASMKDTAGSAGLNDVADFMCTITQDEMLRSGYSDIGSMYFHTILKSRFGKNLQTFHSVVEYEQMKVRTLTMEERELYFNSVSNQIIDIDKKITSTITRNEFSKPSIKVATKTINDLNAIENKKNVIDTFGGYSE